MWIFTKYDFFSSVCAKQSNGRYGQPVGQAEKAPCQHSFSVRATSRLNANDAVWDFFQAHPKPNP
jgi:hypothetical protein